MKINNNNKNKKPKCVALHAKSSLRLFHSYLNETKKTKQKKQQQKNKKKKTIKHQLSILIFYCFSLCLNSILSS